jgi:hypothetical protein
VFLATPPVGTMSSLSLPEPDMTRHMTRPTVTAFWAALVLATTTTTTTIALPAQQLRRGIAAADVLVVATCVRVQPVGDFVLHRLKLQEVLRGKEFLKLKDSDKDGAYADHATVIEVKRVSQHNKPVPARLRLYCLHDHSKEAAKLGLPTGFAPYFRMSGFSGTNPDLTKPLEKDPVMELVRVQVAAYNGRAPRKVSEQIFNIALRGSPRVRNEALKILSENQILLGYVNDLQMRDVLTRAVGETDDIPYKVALCDLCAMKRMNNLVDSLCVSTQQTGDDRFLRALGRIAKYLHREQAAHVLMAQISRAQGKHRDRLIYALGATSTDAALKELLRMQSNPKDRDSVDAALRAHGTRRALKAIREPKPQPGPKKETGKDGR